MATADKLTYLKTTKEEIKTAIIDKGGTVAEDATFRSYADAIAAIPAGGDNLPEEALLITDDCRYRFAYGGWDWFVQQYADQITTQDIKSCNNMFDNANMSYIPFELNMSNSPSNKSLSMMFNFARNLKEVPKINNCVVSETKNMFAGCNSLRYLPEDIADWFDWSYMDNLTSSYTGTRTYMFQECYSLRAIPMDFLSHVNPTSIYSAAFFYYGFNGCHVLDELIDIPVNYTATWSSNAFSSSFSGCRRLKNLTFAMPEGTPYVKNWKSQVIDLTSHVGYYPSHSINISNYNSGITTDKQVTDDVTYQALKDDPDWFTADEAYSRYNHDSAVATINSLPDTSAYLASAGGTNTIKFKGAAGSKTDGGAINTLTEEEIAVATAKGWTVTFA